MHVCTYGMILTTSEKSAPLFITIKIFTKYNLKDNYYALTKLVVANMNTKYIKHTHVQQQTHETPSRKINL